MNETWLRNLANQLICSTLLVFLLLGGLLIQKETIHSGLKQNQIPNNGIVIGSIVGSAGGH